MPRQRPLEVCAGTTLDLVHNMKPLQATLGYVVGEINTQPCGQCTLRIGNPCFPSCVVVAGKFADACVNCIKRNETSGVITLSPISRSNGPALLDEARLRIPSQRLEWISKLANRPGIQLLVCFCEEVLRRSAPESKVIIACDLTDENSIMIENETKQTAAWHCPNGDFDDRMEPGVAEILACREDETYTPIPRKYFNFAGAMSSSLSACIMYERAQTWALLQSHPIYIHLESPSLIKSMLVQFFNIRFSSLFADITGSTITLDPAGETGSATWLRLPDDAPEFRYVELEFATTSEVERRSTVDWAAILDEECVWWSKGVVGEAEDRLWVLNLMIWARLLFEANPEQQSLREIAALVKPGHTDAA